MGAENRELPFLFYHLLSKKIRGNIIHDSFHQLVVNMEEHLPQKGKFRENNECRKVLYGTRYFRGPFPFDGNIFPYQQQTDEINSIW